MVKNDGTFVDGKVEFMYVYFSRVTFVVFLGITICQRM
jgi:hypothetical protein